VVEPLVGALAGRTREQQISWQIPNRARMRDAGVSRTTGALEAELNQLRGVFKGRQHAYRNQERTNHPETPRPGPRARSPRTPP
jgi:hypothetical protein